MAAQGEEVEGQVLKQKDGRKKEGIGSQRGDGIGKEIRRLG